MAPARTVPPGYTRAGGRGARLSRAVRLHHLHCPFLAFPTQLQNPESILFVNKSIYQLVLTVWRTQEAGSLEWLHCVLGTLSFTHPPVTDFVLPGQAGPGYPSVARWHRLCGVVAQESAMPWIRKVCQGADGA